MTISAPGYSALNLLKELEFDILKLDGSFVSGAAAEGYKSDVILRNIIRMADELYMTVLCEGLETAGQVERLNTFGCTLAQGYYFAQPMPAEAFEAFVQQAGGYCALPWGGADGAQRLPDYCEASALTDSAVRSITHSLFDAVPCAVAGVDPSSRAAAVCKRAAVLAVRVSARTDGGNGESIFCPYCHRAGEGPPLCGNAPSVRYGGPVRHQAPCSPGRWQRDMGTHDGNICGQSGMGPLSAVLFLRYHPGADGNGRKVTRDQATF